MFPTAFFKRTWALTFSFIYSDVVEGEESEGNERRVARLTGGGHTAAGAIPQCREQGNRHCESGRVGD